MKQTRILMDMPITIEVTDCKRTSVFDDLFDYFSYIDDTFSTFKKTSEITYINEGKLTPSQYSRDMRTVLSLCEKTYQQSEGFFDTHHNGKLDPSGLVKGWAVWNAAKMIRNIGCRSYYVEAGGDMQMSGCNQEGKPWTVGIRNPFNTTQIVKVISPGDRGVATSGTYERGKHIYNPKNNLPALEIVSLTVIGPNIYEADRFATAAFAMGKQGINFIESRKNLEGYMIDASGKATMTGGFEKFVLSV